MAGSVVAGVALQSAQWGRKDPIITRHPLPHQFEIAVEDGQY